MFRYTNIRRFFSSSNFSPLFELSSVIDCKTLTDYVRKCGFTLQKIIENDLRSKHKNALSRSYLEEVRTLAKRLCLGLTALRYEDVEEIIREQYNLKDERLMTCIVPYQSAVSIIFSRLPVELKQDYMKEVKRIECSQNDCSSYHSYFSKNNSFDKNKWVMWRDEDVYVSTGKKYLSRVKGKEPSASRIPVFAALGHTQHGKTVLLDLLLGTSIASIEPHKITQTCRSITLHSLEKKKMLTFIDTPGDKMFVEARYFCHLICDCILLIISLSEGLESQSYEAIKVALNVDRPIIVVFTKVDLISDEFSLKKKMKVLLAKLLAEGLEVTMLPLKACQKKRKEDAFEASIRVLEEKNVLNQCFFPMRNLDSSYRGSIYHPVLNLQRKCFGIAVSAKERVGTDELLKLLYLFRDTNPSYCFHENIHFSAHNAVVQAVVVDSSKHLFNEEEFRVNTKRQKMQRFLDKRIEKSKQVNGSIVSNMYRMLSAAKQKATSRSNRTSTSSLVVNVIIREGTVTPGMHFVADQSEGCVDGIFTYSGEVLKEATPGMAVTLVDLRSRSGCPGSGSHILSVRDEATRYRIHRYRQMLQWYIEAFPTKLQLLRPEGMDTKFSHVGNFGQIGMKRDSLEAQLLYGKPSSPTLEENSKSAISGASESFQPSSEIRLSGGSNASVPKEVMSVGEYIALKNQESQEKSLLSLARIDKLGCVSPSVCCRPDQQNILRLSDPSSNKSDRIFPSSVEVLLESTWRSYQPEKPCTTPEEYDKFLQTCIHVGVLLKVDSWHSARMLSRELLRWGTNLIVFQVVGIRFGPLCEEDILFFGQAAKIILCFRTPLSSSINLDSYLETQDTWVLQTDQTRDVELFTKWCSVTLHRQEKERNKEK